MPEPSLCTLEMLLEPKGLSIEKFKEEIETLFNSRSLSPKIDLKKTDSGQFLLTVCGSLEIVDECHAEINEQLVKRAERRCVRLRDDAGDAIRAQAYPILAHIEQLLRAFVSRTSVEVCGFDWWNIYAPPKLKEDVQRRKNEKVFVLHPVEYTQFEELVGLITAEVSKWSDSKPLTPADLRELFSGQTSINEVILQLEKNTKKVSLWNDVFARYFADKTQWDQMKKDSLEFVISQRNKVMHHRPIRYGTIQKLEEHETKIQEMLESATATLSVQDREEAKQVFKEWEAAFGIPLELRRRLADEFLVDWTAQLRMAEMPEAARQSMAEMPRDQSIAEMSERAYNAAFQSIAEMYELAHNAAFQRAAGSDQNTDKP